MPCAGAAGAARIFLARALQVTVRMKLLGITCADGPNLFCNVTWRAGTCRRLSDSPRIFASEVAEVNLAAGAPPLTFHGYRRGRELGQGGSSQVFVCSHWLRIGSRRYFG